MTKKSKIAKEKKRQQLVLKYAELRKELIEKGDYEALRKLPRDSSPTRLKNRCELTAVPEVIYENSKCLGLLFVSLPIRVISLE